MQTFKLYRNSSSPLPLCLYALLPLSTRRFVGILRLKNFSRKTAHNNILLWNVLLMGLIQKAYCVCLPKHFYPVCQCPHTSPPISLAYLWKNKWSGDPYFCCNSVTLTMFSWTSAISTLYGRKQELLQGSHGDLLYIPNFTVMASIFVFSYVIFLKCHKNYVNFTLQSL